MKSIEQRISALEQIVFEDDQNSHLLKIKDEVIKVYPTAIVTIKKNRATIIDKNKKPINKFDLAKILNDYFRKTHVKVKGIKLSSFKYEFAVV